MTLRYDWRQAGSTGRAHLAPWQGRRHEGLSACGMVRHAAWMPEGEAVRCGLCRRLQEQARRRADRVLAEEGP